jgi:hypothetical protein
MQIWYNNPSGREFRYPVNLKFQEAHFQLAEIQIRGRRASLDDRIRCLFTAVELDEGDEELDGDDKLKLLAERRLVMT